MKIGGNGITEKFVSPYGEIFLYLYMSLFCIIGRLKMTNFPHYHVMCNVGTVWETRLQNRRS